jgi:glycogen(starch) synthase
VKILISSHMFLPTVGGLQTVSALLAEEFVRVGHQVVLTTETPSADRLPFPYPVARGPNPLRLLHLLRWCDIYFHNNFSLRTAWPLLFVRRPWVITHATWISPLGLMGKFRHKMMGRAAGISISRAIANHVRAPSVVIGNPYDDEVFREMPNRRRDKELVFCGRLVPDKGADLLLKSISILKARRVYPELTVIGSGSEERRLRATAGELGIAQQVTFAGVRTGRELSELLNAHKIMVVPSLWNEPFGVVALEGIACGCVVVGSEGGGLREAIGQCGVTFPNGDSDALAERLQDLLISPQLLVQYRGQAPEHLSHYTRTAVGERYLQIFTAVLDGGTSQLESIRGSSKVESAYGGKVQ